MRFNFKKILLLSVAATFLLIISFPVFAQDNSNGPVSGEPSFIEGYSIKAISKALALPLYAFGYIGGALVILGGNLANWALDLNSHVLQSSTVQIGWVITRDLANLGFVLAMILIAFTTILRIETYQAKKLLWRLIAAALLVNFSLVIAGVFLDFAGVLTDFFINKATNGAPSKIGEGFAKGFQIQKLLVVTQNSDTITSLVAGLGNFLTGLVAFIASLFFVVLFTGIAAISLLGLAIMLFFRYIWLNILLVLAPLAWLSWIWPDLEHYWKDWWNKFLQWIFFAPATAFFIYLAFAIIEKGDAFALNNNSLEAALNSGGALGLIIENIGGIIGQMLVVIGLLTGGLIAAQKMGITGAEASLKMTSAVKNKVLGGAGGFVTERLRAFRYEQPDKEGKGGGGLIQRYSAKLAGYTLIGGLASDVNRWATKAGEKGELVDNYEQEYSHLDKNAFLNIPSGISWKADLIRNPAKAAAFINTAAEKGFLNDVRKTYPKIFDELINASKKMGTEKKIFSRNPTLSGIGILDEKQRNATVKKWVEKTSPTDIANLSADDIYKEPMAGEEPNFTVLLNLSKQQLKKLSVDAKTAQVDAINKGIEKIRQMVKAGKSELDEEQQKSWQYLQNWDNDSIVGQTEQKPTIQKSTIITENIEEEFKKAKKP